MSDMLAKLSKEASDRAEALKNGSTDNKESETAM